MPTSIPSLPCPIAAGPAASGSTPSLVDAYASIFGATPGSAALGATFNACLPGATAGKGASSNAVSTQPNLLSTATHVRSTAVLATTPAKPAAPVKNGSRPSLSRDQIEAVAALLAPVLLSLQDSTPSGGPVAGQSGNEPTGFAPTVAAGSSLFTGLIAEIPTISNPGVPLANSNAAPIPPTMGNSTHAAAQPLFQATITSGDESITIGLPTAPNVAPGANSLTTVRQALSAELTRLFGHSNPAADSTPDSGTKVVSTDSSSSPLSISVQMPSQAVSAVAGGSLGSGMDSESSFSGENSAAANLAVTGAPALSNRSSVQSSAKKDFQVTTKQSVTNAKNESGIGSAQPARIMTDFSADRRNPANPTDSILAVHSRNQSTEVGATANSGSTPTSGPSLAHRAVTTVLNVVNAQDIRPAGNGVVNLHFKFGSDDLSVRVAMRGNEVHTQFNTDSAELRNALATEWRGVASDGSTSGLRLVNPTFSSNGSSDQQLGSGAQGNSSQRDFAQQQPAAQLIFPAAQAFTEEAAPADLNGSSNRMTGPLHTSLHLAAVA